MKLFDITICLVASAAFGGALVFEFAPAALASTGITATVSQQVAPLIPRCEDSYAVRLEENSGPIPKEVVAPRTLVPPRFTCDPGYDLAPSFDGVIVCHCKRL